MENITQQIIINIEELCKKYKINNTQMNNNVYMDSYSTIKPDEINEIRKNYKIIDVEWLNRDNVDYKIFVDEYFNFNQNKIQIVGNMMNYYLSHKDKQIYKKTDYLCNRKEKICICNKHANAFRKIFDGTNYAPEDNFISWIKKSNEPF